MKWIFSSLYQSKLVCIAYNKITLKILKDILILYLEKLLSMSEKEELKLLCDCKYECFDCLWKLLLFNDATHAIYRWRSSSDIWTSNMTVESAKIAVVSEAKQTMWFCTIFAGLEIILLMVSEISIFESIRNIPCANCNGLYLIIYPL